MPNDLTASADPEPPVVYQIRVAGHLGCQWTEWFGGLAIGLEANGETVLSGSVADQAALHGLLKKLRDLGLPLLSVNRMPLKPTGEQPSEAHMISTENSPRLLGAAFLLMVLTSLAGRFGVLAAAGKP